MAVNAPRSYTSGAQVGEIEMVDHKNGQSAVWQQHLADGGEDNDPEFFGTKSTDEDKAHMNRLGKQQQLVRHFRFVSTVAFTAMSTAAWEIGIFLIGQGLTDGGRAGLIYMVLWNFIGFCPIYLSMAEMASMAPTAGGQYHWVSEFSHPKLQKWLSYTTGWVSTMSWQAGNAVGVFLTGTLIQVIILENNPNYAFPAWQGSLFVIAVILAVALINIYGYKLIPKVQQVAFLLHLMGFVCLIVPIWVIAPKATAKEVFTDFNNFGGWSSQSLALLVGQLSGIYTQIGVDTAAHIAEEVRNASKAVPRAMMLVWGINFCFIFPAVVTLCFAMPDLKKAIYDPSTFATVYVLRQTMSAAWETVVLVMIIVLLMWANVSYLTAVARDLFAFSRDGGFPFSAWISKIDPDRHVPINAVIVTSGIAVVLSLIYIGSPIAFYAITSLLTVALLQCYMFSIGSILWRRIRAPETLPPSAFSLGRWGIPVNTAGFLYAAWAFFWAFWPVATPVTAKGFNWSSVIFVGVLIFSLIWYFVRAHKVYEGPVVLTRKR